MALTAAQQAALTRLGGYYEGDTPYNASTNPGGFRQGGQVVNFVPALKDVALAVQGASSLIADALAAAANSPKAVRVDSALAFSPTEMVQGIANLGLLSQYLAMTPAQQALFRLNIGAASNDDLRAIGRYVAKLSGSAIKTGNRVIEEFNDSSGIDPSSTNATVLNGQVLNQAADPNCKSLLHLDGSENSTVISDDIAGHTWTASGGAKLTQAQKVFGTASLLLSASGDFISAAAHADFGFGTGDFTLNLRVRLPSVSGAQALFDNRNSSGQGFEVLILNGVLRFYDWGTASYITPGSATLAANTFYDIEISRASGTIRQFINGVQDGAAATCTSNFGASNPVWIGQQYNGSNPAPGYYDEIRQSNVARHNANFTPATSPFAAGTSGALDLKSIVFPVQGGQPSRAAIWFAYQTLSGSPVLNTDIVAKATRTGNFANAQAFPLTNLITIGGYTFVKADFLDISTQPAGSSPAYEILCPANIAMVLDTVEFEYGN